LCGSIGARPNAGVAAVGSKSTGDCSTKNLGPGDGSGDGPTNSGFSGGPIAGGLDIGVIVAPAGDDGTPGCCSGCRNGLFSSIGVATDIVLACASFSRARRSCSLAARWALVTNVILIFFISFAKLSISLVGFSVGDGSGETLTGVADSGEVLAEAPLSVLVVILFGALGARMVASFFAGTRVFLTLMPLPLATRTLTDDSGLMVNDVLGLVLLRIGAERGAGGTASTLSDTIVDAALRRRPDCLGSLFPAGVPP